jgi:hypothetical protein
METHNLDLKLFADWPESGNLGNFSLDRVVMYSSSKGEKTFRAQEKSGGFLSAYHVWKVEFPL